MKYLSMIAYLFITIVMISFLWPVLKWFLLIVIIALGYLLYKIMHSGIIYKNNYQQGSTNQRNNDDVIDVKVKVKENNRE